MKKNCFFVLLNDMLAKSFFFILDLFTTIFKVFRVIFEAFRCELKVIKSKIASELVQCIEKEKINMSSEESSFLHSHFCHPSIRAREREREFFLPHHSHPENHHPESEKSGNRILFSQCELVSDGGCGENGVACLAVYILSDKRHHRARFAG